MRSCRKRRDRRCGNFTAEDCVWLCEDNSIKNHAVVISPSAIPRYGQGQIFFCIGGEGAETNVGRYLAPLVSLSTGELCHVRCEDVLGALKPELLPDEARLHLSQLRPADALDLKTHTPEYSGYSFRRTGVMRPACGCAARRRSGLCADAEGLPAPGADLRPG